MQTSTSYNGAAEMNVVIMPLHHNLVQMMVMVTARGRRAVQMDVVIDPIYDDFLRTVVVVRQRLAVDVDVLIAPLYHDSVGVVVMVVMGHGGPRYVDMVVVPLHHNSAVIVVVVIVNVDIVIGALNGNIWAGVAHWTRRIGQVKETTVDVDIVTVTFHDYLVQVVVVVVMVVVVMTFVQRGRESLGLHIADRHTAANPKASHASHGVNGIDFSLQHTPMRREHALQGFDSPPLSHASPSTLDDACVCVHPSSYSPFQNSEAPCCRGDPVEEEEVREICEYPDAWSRSRLTVYPHRPQMTCGACGHASRRHCRRCPHRGQWP